MSFQLRDGGEPPRYTATDLFSLEIHHGGYLVDGFYLGEKVHWKDNISRDCITMWDLWELVEYLGYNKETTKFFYKKKRKGWVPITCDADYFQCAKCVTKRSIVVIYLTDKSQEVQNIEIQASLQNAITDINVEDVILIEGSHVAQEPGYVDLEGEYVADDECDEEDDREEYVVNGGALVDAELEVDDVVDEAEEPDEDDEDFRDSDYEQSEDEDDNKFHKFVVPEDTEEQYKEPGEEETDEYDTEEFDSLHGSESEQENKLKLSKSLEAPRFKQYNRDHDLRDTKLCLGLEFPTVGECREALRYYANGCARMVRFEKNDTVRVKMVCNGESEEGPCPWKVYASRVKRGPTFRIKTFIECHTCGREEKAKFATSSWLAERFDEDLRRNPNMSVPYFMEMPTSANPRQPSETNTTSNDASQTRPLRKAKLQVGRRESLVKRGGHVAQTTRTISEGGSQHQSVMHPRGSEAVLQGQSVITGEPRRFKSAVKRARTWRP
ncbi:hypothetical protein PS2_044830 [Malus domestica]